MLFSLFSLLCNHDSKKQERKYHCKRAKCSSCSATNFDQIMPSTLHPFPETGTRTLPFSLLLLSLPEQGLSFVPYPAKRSPVLTQVPWSSLKQMTGRQHHLQARSSIPNSTQMLEATHHSCCLPWSHYSVDRVLNHIADQQLRRTIQDPDALSQPILSFNLIQHVFLQMLDKSQSY